MSEQNASHHARYVPLYHYVLSPALILAVGGAIQNFRDSIGDHQRIYSASLLLLVTVALVLVALYARSFALKAQDRAIRAEENLRHFAMTGALLDPRITMAQIIALRFASDGEFVALARRAAESGLSPKDIKQAITKWRADHHRV